VELQKEQSELLIDMKKQMKDEMEELKQQLLSQFRLLLQEKNA